MGALAYQRLGEAGAPMRDRGEATHLAVATTRVDAAHKGVVQLTTVEPLHDDDIAKGQHCQDLQSSRMGQTGPFESAQQGWEKSQEARALRPRTEEGGETYLRCTAGN